MRNKFAEYSPGDWVQVERYVMGWKHDGSFWKTAKVIGHNPFMMTVVYLDGTKEAIGTHENLRPHEDVDAGSAQFGTA